jgi:hypothetical protein
MLDSIRKNEHAGSFSRRQQLFVRYILFILIDLAVLNLFNEFWAYVSITYFSISLLAVLLLQILLQLTIAIEHRVAKYFIEKQGLKAKVHRALSTWLILFISKLVILQAINYAFGESVLFGGPLNGVIAFIIVVITIVMAEQIFLRLYRSLA